MQKFIIFTAAFLTLFSVAAQQGAVSGTIIDTDGFPLIGANIVIEGTTIGAQTDFDGKYSFKADAGVYTLVTSYIGYADNQFPGFEIKANQTVIHDIVMEEGGGVDLTEIVVQATRVENSENAVLMIRKGSDKVQDIISSQEISRLGASNAAAAMTKVTGTTVVDGKYVYVRGLGDRYSATTMNGLRLPSIDPYRNAAQLDLIPASVVDNIITSKTFTPDLPGDFTGGSVNLKLKSLPERFTYGVSVSTSYNAQANLRDDFLSFDAGKRAGLGYNDGSLDRPAFLSDQSLVDNNILSSNADRPARNDDEFAALLDRAVRSFDRPFTVASNSNSALDYKVSANIGTQVELGKTRIGMFATGSFNKDYSQYQGGIRANYLNPSEDVVLIRDFDLIDNRSVESSNLNGMVGLSIRPNNLNAINLYTLYSHQGVVEGRDVQGAYDEYGTGGENTYFKSQTAWFLEREMTSYVASGEHRLGREGNGMRVEWTANLVNSSQNEPDIRYFAYTFDNIFQANESQVAGPQRFFRDLTDQSAQGKLDFTLPFLKEKSKANSIKFGGLYNRKERDFNELAYEYKNANGNTINDSAIDGGLPDPAIYTSDENLGVIGESATGRNIIGLYLNDNSNLSNSYTGFSEVAAAYAMVTYELSPKLKAIFGVRAESTQILVESDIVPNELSQTEREPDLISIAENTASIDTTVFLPALNLVYNLTEQSNLRASFTQTLARPNMREVAPFASFGFVGEPIVIGNPNLNQSLISNFDLRYEFFPARGGEVIAVSAFYKDFRDPIVETFRQSGDQQFTWTNSESAMLYGIELEFKKNLDVFGSAFENFTFGSNFSYIQSEQEIDDKEFELGLGLDPDFQQVRRFNGQSDFIANANLSYQDKKGWDVMVAYNYFGDRLVSIGAVGSPDIFERGRSQLDASVSKKINRVKITARARNLLNPRYERFSEFKGQEYIFSSFDRGIDFSMNLSYNF